MLHQQPIITWEQFVGAADGLQHPVFLLTPPQKSAARRATSEMDRSQETHHHPEYTMATNLGLW